MLTMPAPLTWAVIAAALLLAMVVSKFVRTVIVLGVLLVAAQMVPFVDLSLF